jgi:hypothetical protein
MAGNLPPGVTPQDIDDHYGPTVPRHDHHWELTRDEPFVLEDDLAVFNYVCGWAPTKTVDIGRYGTEDIQQGPGCKEEERVALETDAEPAAVEYVETAYMDDTLSVVECCEPRVNGTGGRLVVEASGYQVVYE